MRNVELAINLAYHFVNGWDDAVLPDNYKDIGELLRMPAEQHNDHAGNGCGYRVQFQQAALRLEKGAFTICAAM